MAIGKAVRIALSEKTATMKTLLSPIGPSLMFLLLTVQCRLFGPEPGEPVYPAPIDFGDSCAVRAILDSNNLRNISVRKAIDPSSKGRITMVSFNSLSIDSFTLTTDLEKLDSLSSINLSYNEINLVKVPDSLQFSHLYEIRLENNLLTQFPIGLLKIKGLLKVNVQYNKISSIQQELITSGFRQVYLEHNKLCSVSDSEKIWLDSVQNNWANFQDCP